MSNRYFWCPKPVSFVGDWSVSYIGDRSRAPKSFANLGEGEKLKVSGGRLSSKVEILGGYTNRKFHEVQFNRNFGCPKPVSYVGDWSVSYIGDRSRAPEKT